MTLKQYFPISVAVFMAVVVAVYFSPVPIPVMPIAIILLVGETLMGFQVEDHKVPKLLSALVRPSSYRP
jgi:hypothetical protein